MRCELVHHLVGGMLIVNVCLERNIVKKIRQIIF